MAMLTLVQLPPVVCVCRESPLCRAGPEIASFSGAVREALRPLACRSLSQGALGGGALASRAKTRFRGDFRRTRVRVAVIVADEKDCRYTKYGFLSGAQHISCFTLIMGAVSLLWRRKTRGARFDPSRNTQLLIRLFNLYFNSLILLLISTEDGVYYSH